MKYSVQLFLITYICIATNMSIAMELEISQNKNCKEKKTKIREIPCVTDPFDAFYLTENTILINGRNHCSIVDLTTNTEIKRIFDPNGWSSCIAMHPNKTKFVLAAYHYASDDVEEKGNAQQKITIYDAKTCNPEYIIDWDGATIEKMLFSSANEMIAICEDDVDVILYNYKTKNNTTIEVPEAIREHLKGYNNRSPIFAFHPTQSLMCLAWQTAYIHDLQTFTNKPMTKAPDYHLFCEYSPDGSFIALGTNHQISCSKPDQLPHFTIISRAYSNFDGEDDYDTFYGMAIHPNGKILMTLSRSPYRTSDNFDLLQYWDINTNRCIATQNVRFIPRDYRSPISFCPSGAKLLIVMNNMCLEFKVPFKVLYKEMTKKRFSYLLLLLKNYTRSCADIEMPQELNLCIAKILLKLYKR